MESISETVSAYIGQAETDVLAIARKAPRKYKRYLIPKKRKGMRAIHHPAKETKALQYALMETVLRTLRVHDSAVAYRRNRRAPLRRNAAAHAQWEYSIKIDFHDFFHSILPDDLFKTFRANGASLSQADRVFLTHCLFLGPRGINGLPIGAPSSPIVSNAVMHDFDERMRILANSLSPHSVYTRYADDITFSTDEKGACRKFHEGVRRLLPQIEYPRLRLNPSKTVYASRGTRRVVTGLVITPDGRVSLGRAKKRYIRKLLFDFTWNRLGPADRSFLSGYLAFIMDVEPDFYNRLVIKYTAETVERALKAHGP